jgi:xanthine dehydrogenase YagS FAD-binding subunit
MHSFAFEQIGAVQEAIAAAGHNIQGATSYLAGGTTLLDLMKLDVMQPSRVIDINPLDRTAAGRIDVSDKGVRLGALVRMAEAADHPFIRKQYPVIGQALKLAASQQIRNMASLGGNVLQRTRCSYFRDISYAACNKRNSGSGCAALTGFNRSHAVLGTSDDCIASYPGDFAQALIALDATIEIAGPRGDRSMPFASLHRKPEGTPDHETNLRPGELIVAFNVPATAWARRSLYLKVRDRESYEFALASAAVALELDSNTVRNVRIALGGVATVPWRSVEAEAILRGKTLDDSTSQAAADAAFAGARGRGRNDFKIELGKRTLIRALKETAALEV